MSAERAAGVRHSRVVGALALLAAIVALALSLSVTSALAGPTTTTAAPTTTEAPTTTAAPTTTQAPTVITPTVTEPSSESASGSSGLSTDTKLAIVVGGLVAVGGVIGVLTFLYWRHTRPPQYLTALDALADIEVTTVPTGPGATSLGAAALGVTHRDVDPVTDETPTVGLASVATRSVRVIEPDPSPEPSPRDDDFHLAAPAEPAAVPPVDDEASISEILFGPGPDVEAGSSPPMVTLEDLFGPDTDPKGPPRR